MSKKKYHEIPLSEVRKIEVGTTPTSVPRKQYPDYGSGYAPGDVVLVYGGDDPLSSTIRWGTRSKGEARTKITHLAIVTSLPDRNPVAPDPYKTYAIGAEWRVRQRKLSEWPYRRVVRLRNIPPGTGSAIAEHAIRSMGRKYAWWLYFTFIIDEKLVGGRNWFRRLTRNARRPICSTLLGWCYEQETSYEWILPTHDVVEQLRGRAPDVVRKLLSFEQEWRNLPWYALTPDDVDDVTRLWSDDWLVVEDTLNAARNA